MKQNYKIKPGDDVSIVLPFPVRELELLPEDIPIEIVFTGFDIDGDPLTFEIIENPSHGIIENGFYVPNQDYNGEDEFSYSAFDSESGRSFI